jgi:flagellar basal-body rod protein FlgC
MDAIIANALSGLTAARQRLEVSAANVANANSDGVVPGSSSDPQAPQVYTPLRVEQVPLVSGGTFATVLPVDPRLVRRFVPDSPAANADGIIASPNVDLVGEGINQLTATQAYKANLRLIQVAQELERETADMLGRNRHDLTA